MKNLYSKVQYSSQDAVALMSKPIALYQDMNYFSKVILFKLGWLGYFVRLVNFFRLDYIDSICLVKWQGLLMLS